MDSIKNGDHFQKIFLPILTGLLKDMGMPASEAEDFDAKVEKAFCRSVVLWCTPELDERYRANLAEKLADIFGYGEDRTEPVMQAIGKARDMAQKAILSASYRVVNNFYEAAEYMIDFAGDSTRRSVMFGVDSGGSQKHYVVFKLPYNDRVDFFYGKYDYFGPNNLNIGGDMKYLGFVDNASGTLYDLREPMTICWHCKPYAAPNRESGEELKKAVTKAFQNEVARRVAEKMPELPDMPPPEELLELLKDVEADYSGGVSVADFAGRVKDTHYYIRTNDIVHFVTEPEALIAERADDYMKRYGAEMERRWIAYLAADKMLSYTAALGDAAKGGRLNG